MLYPPALCFITLVNTSQEERHARLFIESLRAFGGTLRHAPLWVFFPQAFKPGELQPGLENVHLFPLDLPTDCPAYPFTEKVCACAQAEAMAGRLINSLVWVNPECLVVNPPLLFDLGMDIDAAFRPVHLSNIGSPAFQAPDGYWQRIYRLVGLKDAPFTVESFVDFQTLRPYFNTHCFSVCSSLGLFRAWQRCFMTLVLDPAFQSECCADELHRLFLHQAVLSALVAQSIPATRIRSLPPEYSYPLHLHPRVAPECRPRNLNELVCPVYEDSFSFPATLNGLEVEKEFASWFSEQMSQAVKEKLP